MADIQDEFTTPILKLDEAILRRLTTFIIRPEWDMPFRDREKAAPTLTSNIPDFPSFFALASTCRSLRLALVRPDEDEGYWRSLLLDVGQGRRCRQTLLVGRKEIEVPGKTELNPTWGDIARKIALMARHAGKARRAIHLDSLQQDSLYLEHLYRGRGEVGPVFEASEESRYYEASRLMFTRLRES
jgi:hypothetical protein